MDANDKSTTGAPEARSDRATAADWDQAPPSSSPGAALKEAAARLGELKEYAGYFVATKLDAIKISARNIGIYVVLGLLGMVVGAAVLCTATVLLLLGVAHGLGSLFGDRYWLGDLVVGVLVLGGIAITVVVGMKALTRTFKKQLVSKYEDRQRRERDNFGRDVEERAASAAAAAE